MILGLLVYFFIMRSKTVKISKRPAKEERKEHDTTQSPSKIMALISFDRMSPEKVVPIAYTDADPHN